MVAITGGAAVGTELAGGAGGVTHNTMADAVLAVAKVVVSFLEEVGLAADQAVFKVGAEEAVGGTEAANIGGCLEVVAGNTVITYGKLEICTSRDGVGGVSMAEGATITERWTRVA